MPTADFGLTTKDRIGTKTRANPNPVNPLTKPAKSPADKALTIVVNIGVRSLDHILAHRKDGGISYKNRFMT